MNLSPIRFVPLAFFVVIAAAHCTLTSRLDEVSAEYGKAHAGGSNGTGCNADSECQQNLPRTQPLNCMEGHCDLGTKKCQLLARDADGDGHRAKTCVALDGAFLQTGDDCDDTDPTTYPGAWDGPEVPGDPTKPNRCDNKNHDCDKVPQDGVTPDGRRCMCDPNMSPIACAEKNDGMPIQFPSVSPLGVCRYGIRECKNGIPGACQGAIGPSVEVCDGLDNDCNGKVDDNAKDQKTWYYDGDDDGYGALSTKPVMSCSNPAQCPAENKNCSNPDHWKPGITNNDCDDTDPNTHPGAWDGPATAVTLVGFKSPGLKAEYFASGDLTSGVVLTRNERVVNYNWQTLSPDSSISNANFSVRWTGFLSVATPGTYVFSTNHDDGLRMFINKLANSIRVIDQWSTGMTSGSIDLPQAGDYPITIEYSQQTGADYLQIQWSGPGIPTQDIVTQSNPVGGAHPNRCDGKDQDCDGKADEQVVMDGDTMLSCASLCTPDQLQTCAVKAGCTQGLQRCDKTGFWSACYNNACPGP